MFLQGQMVSGISTNTIHGSKPEWYDSHMYLKQNKKEKEEEKKSCMGHLGEIWAKYEQKHSGIEGIYTYSTVPRLGKHKGKRESTVSMSKRVWEKIQETKELEKSWQKRKKREDQWSF